MDVVLKLTPEQEGLVTPMVEKEIKAHASRTRLRSFMVQSPCVTWHYEI